MKVIQCDRCQKTYTSNSKTIKVVKIAQFLLTTTDNDMDLCPDCVAELEKFLNIEKEGETA